VPSLIKSTFGTAAQPLTLTLPFRRGEGIRRRNVVYLDATGARHSCRFNSRTTSKHRPQLAHEAGRIGRERLKKSGA
jgi:hypothetical protein